MDVQTYRRKVLKKCAQCGKNELVGSSKWYCPDCKAMRAEWARKRKAARTPEQILKDKEYVKQYIEKRKAEGICLRCGRKAEEGRIYCIGCKLKKRENSKERRRRAKYEHENH